MKTTIYLVRHGTTDWNEAGRYQGLSDIPLNEKGAREAEEVGKALSTISFSTIYSSPLIRAHATANEIAKHQNIPVKLIEKLKERSYGEFEGMTFNEIEQNPYFQNHLKDSWYLAGAPKGESFEETTTRVADALSEIVANHGHETIGIVAHGGVIKSIGYHIGHLEKDSIAKVLIANAKPLRIEYLHSDKKYNVIDFPFSMRK